MFNNYVKLFFHNALLMEFLSCFAVKVLMQMLHSTLITLSTKTNTHRHTDTHARMHARTYART